MEAEAAAGDAAPAEAEPEGEEEEIIANFALAPASPLQGSLKEDRGPYKDYIGLRI